MSSRPRSTSSTTASAANIWERLRAQFERMQQVSSHQSARAALAQKLADRARVLQGRQDAKDSIGPVMSFLAFHHDGRLFGAPLDAILAVEPLDQYSPVPGMPDFIRGVFHWRGSILSLLDIGRLLELPQRGLSDVHACLIVEAAGKRIALLAGDVEEIHTVPLAALQSLPEMAGRAPNEWIAGVCDSNRVILHLERILQDGRLLNWRKPSIER